VEDAAHLTADFMRRSFGVASGDFGLCLVWRTLAGRVGKLVVSPDELERRADLHLHLARRQPLAAQFALREIGPDALDGAGQNVLLIEANLRRGGKGKRLVIANGAEAEVNAGLVELIKEAFTIRIQLLSGSDASIEAMSGRLGMNKCRLTSLIRLSYLAPDIVRALLEGRQPIELTPTRLLRLSKDLPHDWSEQRRVLGFAA